MAAFSPTGAGTGPAFTDLLQFCHLPVDGAFGTSDPQDIPASLSATCRLEVPTPLPEKAWAWCSSPLLGRGRLDIQLSPCMQLI